MYTTETMAASRDRPSINAQYSHGDNADNTHIKTATRAAYFQYITRIARLTKLLNNRICALKNESLIAQILFLTKMRKTHLIIPQALEK